MPGWNLCTAVVGFVFLLRLKSDVTFVYDNSVTATTLKEVISRNLWKCKKNIRSSSKVVSHPDIVENDFLKVRIWGAYDFRKIYIA